MRDPGPARSGSALLCSARWLHTQPPNYREQSRAASHLSLHPKPPSSLPPSPLPLTSRRLSGIVFFNGAHGDFLVMGRLILTGCTFISRGEANILCVAPPPRRRTPVFVFCHEEASAASLSARLFLKDMRSYPARPFPFPANPNKAGMHRERTREMRETEGALFLAR